MGLFVRWVGKERSDFGGAFPLQDAGQSSVSRAEALARRCGGLGGDVHSHKLKEGRGMVWVELLAGL
jgi:hypothetical protein